MFEKNKELSKETESFMNDVYDFILNSEITERERKIGILAKKDLEKNRYLLAVLNQMSSSFQMESMNVGLTPVALQFYKSLEPMIGELAPIGTNRGVAMLGRSYLD